MRPSPSIRPATRPLLRALLSIMLLLAVTLAVPFLGLIDGCGTNCCEGPDPHCGIVVIDSACSSSCGMSSGAGVNELPDVAVSPAPSLPYAALASTSTPAPAIASPRLPLRSINSPHAPPGDPPLYVSNSTFLI